jgi:hypothetical protein
MLLTNALESRQGTTESLVYVSEDETEEDSVTKQLTPPISWTNESRNSLNASYETSYSRSSSLHLPSGGHSISAFRPKHIAELQIFYNLTQFHLAFALGSMYIGMVFSGWELTTNIDGGTAGKRKNFSC